ncbi:hypothetical protein Van01_09260 [Micromonospora andamanensis]|uniref:Uncharacterized protein n=1 Tax=Micromonospora andamanensis TaxID=1287068 RepID=A0ABQ4HQ09_9ACTN|nr:hypothetical protein Van01_09260 [Micromonospora andamanensis]
MAPYQHLCRAVEQISSVETINGKTSMDNVSVNGGDIPAQPAQTTTSAGPCLGAEARAGIDGSAGPADYPGVSRK